MRVSFLLLLLVITVATSSTCFVVAEKESLRGRRFDIASDETRDESKARYLKRDQVTETAAVDEERGFSLKGLKKLFRFKSPKTNPTQLASTFSKSETKQLEKAAIEISKTKFTPAETKKLRKAASTVIEGKLTRTDVATVKQTADVIVQNPTNWRKILKGVLNMWPLGIVMGAFATYIVVLTT